MKADETRLGALLEGEHQYVVPYFQRAYSWREPQWKTLYEDVQEVLHSSITHGHFLGAIVLLREQAPERAASRLVIDGQQRLVTLCLLLAATRDVARPRDPALAERIHAGALVAPGADGQPETKMHCSQQDQPAFAAVILGAKELLFSPITDAYRTFVGLLTDDLERGLDLGQLAQVLLGQLSFVAITLDAEDNPFRIFESLNAKGMPLTQGDLLRNYFFMRLPTAEHDRLYRTVWAPMQTLLGSNFDAFMRDFLVKEGAQVRPDEVYQGWRKRLGPLSADEVQATLTEVAAWAVEYDRLLHPQREPDAALRTRLERLATWSNTLQPTLNPFLLRLRADFSAGHLTSEQLQRLLLGLESFLVRRLFAAAPRIDENALFLSLYNAASESDDRGATFLAALARPQAGWPSDDDLREGMARYPLYLNSHPDQRQLILQALEDSYPHRAPARYQELEIELVTPLLPTPDWLAEVGVRENAYWRVALVVGNLTWKLRGTSPALGVPERKREIVRLARYGLALIPKLTPDTRWDAAAIEQRSRELAEQAVGVWPGPQAFGEGA